MLGDVSSDDRQEQPALTPAAMRQVYEEARRIAHSVLAGRGRNTWGTTGLVNEAFVRLLGGAWAQRVASEPTAIVPALRRVMENAITDHHRRKAAARRPGGEGRTKVYYDDALNAFDDNPLRFVELLRLVERLRAGTLGAVQVAEPAKFAEAVELGFILGCSAREIAAQIDVPQTTVSRWLRYGKALLNHALSVEDDGDA